MTTEVQEEVSRLGLQYNQNIVQPPDDADRGRVVE